MANSRTVTMESELWKFLSNEEMKRAGMYEISIAKKPTILRKITYEENHSIHVNMVIWATPSTDVIDNWAHGILAKGSDGNMGSKICILHSRLYAKDGPSNARNFIGNWLADGWLPQEQKRSLEEGFYALEELMNSAVVDGTEENCARADEYVQEMELPDGFFRNMKTLQAISLLHTSMPSLPSSLFLLNELRVLILRGCRWLAKIPIWIGRLKKLEVLDFSYTEIRNLPEEMGELINLQKLGLRGLSIRMISFGISKLRKLQELDMFKSFIQWGEESGVRISDRVGEGSESSGPTRGVSLKQVTGLETLSSLQIMVEKFECVNEGMVGYLRRLRRFQLVIGPHHGVHNFDDSLDENYDKVLVFKFCQCDSLDMYKILSDLECLIISTCRKLSTVSLVVGPQRRLRELRIEHCDNLREITRCGNESPLRILETLSLVSLPLLEGELELGENLSKVQITRCPQLKNLQTTLSKVWRARELFVGNCEGIESLEETQFEELEKLRIYCLSQLKSIGVFRSLTVLHLWRCSELKNFPFSFHEFKNLESLHVSDVCEMDVVVDVDANGATTVLPRLKSLQLRRLQSLRSIWKGKIGIGSLGNLGELTISECPNLKTLFPSGFQMLKKLKKVYISHCDGLEKIVEETEIEDEGIPLENLETIDLRNLPRLISIFAVKSEIGVLENIEVLYLSQCSALKVVIPSFSKQLKKLRHIYLGNSDSVEHIIGSEGVLETALPSLKKILLFNLSRLRALWQGEVAEGSLKSLNFLEITRCPKLKNILTSGLDKLTNLELIRVNDCGEIERMAYKNPIENFGLPALRVLDLSNLGEMKVLWKNGLGIGALKSLERLTIGNCSKLETLWHGEIGTGALASLRTLRVWKCPALKILIPSNLQQFDNLEEIGVTDCQVEMIAKDILEENALQSLKTMELRGLPRLEVLWIEGAHGAAGTLRELKRVWLKDCPSLKMLPFTLIKCQNLENLAVENCSSIDVVIQETHEDVLMSLVSMYLQTLPNLKVISDKAMGVGCLENLEYLKLSGISGLKSLRPDLCLLRKLRRLQVSDCCEIEELISDVKWEQETLESLEYLELEDLPKLKNLWEGVPGMVSLKILRRLYVRGCCELKTLPYGLLKLEKLEQLHAKNCNAMETTFQEEGEEVAVMSSLIEVKLEMMPQLRRVWEGIAELPQLKYVTAIECPQLERLPFVLNSSSLQSITGGKDWWDALEIEADVKSSLHKYYKPWPMEQSVVKRRWRCIPPRHHF